MPQVSRKPLSKSTEKRMFEIFFKSLAKLSDPLDIEKLLYDLLGPVEKTMLAKRLAIALLLTKGYQYESIKSILHVSQETIARVNIALNHNGEGYMMVVKKLLKEERLKTLLENIEDTA